MNKRTLLFGLAVILTLAIITSPVSAEEDTDITGNDTQTTETGKCSKGKKEKKQEAAEPENAIGKAVAKEKALADAGLTADQLKKIKACVSQNEDGTVFYKVGFVFEGQKYSYRIDALSGNILEKSSEEFSVKATKDLNAKGKSAGKHKNRNSENSSSDSSL